MKLLFSFFVILVLSNSLLYSQRIELACFGGVSNYEGDLVPHAFDPGEFHIAYGGEIKFNCTKLLTMRGGYFHGMISGSDARNGNAAWQLKRNLSFRSPITEESFVLEFNLLGWRTPYFARRFTPYAEIGMGFFKFNPQTLYNGSWVDLEPLGTEGQGLIGYPAPYNLKQFSFPYGGGVKFAFTRNLSMCYDLGFRWTMTDYLDDVSSKYVDPALIAALHGNIAADLSDRSDEIFGIVKHKPGTTRGDATHDDLYFFTGLTLNYTITHTPAERKLTEKQMDDYGCYRFHRWMQ